MSALFGWTGGSENERGAHILERMAGAAHADGTATLTASRPEGSAGVVGRPSTLAVVTADAAWLALVGHPRRAGQALTGDGSAQHAQALLRDLRADPQRALAGVQGDFALAMFDAATGRTLLAVDRMAIHPLSYQHQGGTLLFGSTLDSIGRHPRLPHFLTQPALGVIGDGGDFAFVVPSTV